MSSKYGIFCIPLFFVILILGYENYEIWSPPSAASPRKETGKKKKEVKSDSAVSSAAPREVPSREAINIVAEKNVFNPERKEFPAMAGGAIAKPVARPQITLYGVAIADGYETASVVNPGRPLHKGERETKTLKVGDMVGEYKLSRIMPDRIVMEAGDDSFEVLLHDPRAPKKRLEIKTPAKPAAVTSTVFTATPPSAAQPASPPATAPAAPPVPLPRSVTPLLRPRPLGTQSPGTFPPPGLSTSPSASPSSVPEPGVWRGRRPVTPAEPSAAPSG
jgi:hypothetical protein